MNCETCGKPIFDKYRQRRYCSRTCIRTGYKPKFRKAVLDEEEDKLVFDYLKGTLSCYELGEKLGISHQAAINFIARAVRNLYHEQKLLSP